MRKKASYLTPGAGLLSRTSNAQGQTHGAVSIAEAPVPVPLSGVLLTQPPAPVAVPPSGVLITQSAAPVPPAVY
jgi:hypothetical protein